MVFLFGCNKNTLESVSKNLTNYNLNLAFNENENKLSGVEKVDYVNATSVVLNKLEFHLYPNAFRADAKYKPVSVLTFEKAYPNGFSAGEIEISGVKVGNLPVDVQICGNDKNILAIDLKNSLYPDDRVAVEIEFCVTLPNCAHRFGFGENTYNFGNFYPIVCVYENGAFREDNYGSNGDPFYSEMANYNVSVSYPKEFVMASTGELQTTENGQTKTSVARAKTVRDFAFVLSKKFNVISKKAGNTTVFYYYYDDETADASLQAGVDAISTFSKLFGVYPYSTFSVVKANFVHGGMEYPNLVYISDADMAKTDYINVIIHETAHQWWYNLVGSDAVNEAWQDEGLTEFSTLLFYKHNKSYGVDMKESLNSSLSSYLLFSEVYTAVYDNFDSTMSKNVGEFSGDMEYTYVTYVKGVLFFDNLMETIGEKNFMKGLKYYFSHNEFKLASKADMVSAFELCSKRALDSFFSSWLDGKVVLQNNK